MTHLRSLLLVAGLALVLAVANYDIIRKQQIVDEGMPILLELGPADPRSLMQGDYMTLRYADTVLPPAAIRESLPRRGTAVLELDGNGVARFARLDDGTALGDDEHRLNFKRRLYHRGVSYGAEAFFFQEGDAERYGDAKYGVLHVDPDGDSVLVGLADADRKMLTRR
jgi:uncharacterized membrane-anchored protein